MASIRVTIENRNKYVPAKIKLNNNNNELFVEKINKNIRVYVQSQFDEISFIKLLQADYDRNDNPNEIQHRFYGISPEEVHH